MSYIDNSLKPEKALELKIQGDKVSLTHFKRANNQKPSSQSYDELK